MPHLAAQDVVEELYKWDGMEETIALFEDIVAKEEGTCAQIKCTCFELTKERKNILKINKEIGMMLPKKRDDAAKKRANTSGVGESNNYYEDIYNIPPYTKHSLTTPIDSTH